MSEVRRYGTNPTTPSGMGRHPHGGYVTYTAYSKLAAALATAEQKVADAELLLLDLQDEAVMTHDGTQDIWEVVHAAAEGLRNPRAAREESSDE